MTHMETSPQESPGRGGVAAPGACTSSSGHTGVSWDNSKQAYRARSSCKLSGVSGQPRHLGHYPTSHDAAAAVNLYHEVLAWCLTWGVEVEPPPNAVPAGVALGRAEEAYVRSCALNAELDFWRAKEAALTAQLAEERRSSCADYLTACQLVPELASFVTTIATGGVLPGDLVVEYAMDAVTNAAKLREGGPAANGVRWRSRIKVVAAAAAAQCSGEATLNVLRGDVKDPGLPFPSTSTNRRTMGEDGVVPDATVGVLPTGIRKFVARCHVAGRPNADACMGTDGVDIPVSGVCFSWWFGSVHGSVTCVVTSERSLAAPFQLLPRIALYACRPYWRRKYIPAACGLLGTRVLVTASALQRWRRRSASTTALCRGLTAQPREYPMQRGRTQACSTWRHGSSARCCRVLALASVRRR